MSTDCIIETKGLGKVYSRVRVLADIDLSIRKGEILTIVGENGAGKSTLVRILSGIMNGAEGWEADIRLRLPDGTRVRERVK